MFAKLENNIPLVITERVYVYNDIQYPVDGFDFYTDEELEEIGVYRINIINPVENYIQTGSVLVWNGERVEEIPVGNLLSQEEIDSTRRQFMKLSFAQMIIGLVTENWITPEEGRAWRDRISLPLQVNNLIMSLPPEQQFAAETRILAAIEINRLDPLVTALGMVEGKTPQQLDEFFITYAQV